jgi:hypothetical protein
MLNIFTWVLVGPLHTIRNYVYINLADYYMDISESLNKCGIAFMWILIAMFFWKDFEGS